MSRLGEYVKEVVEPTFKDFQEDSTPRRAFLAAVAIYHAIDRAAEDMGRKSSGNLRKEWGDVSMAFKLVDVVAHRFKHTKSDDEPKRPEQWNYYLSFADVLRRTTVIQFNYTMKDAISFLKEQAKKMGPKNKPAAPSAQ